MKIKVGIWKGIKSKYKKVTKDTELLSYEVQKFNRKGFETRLIKKIKCVNKRFKNIKGKETACIATDLIYEGKCYTGGCTISGATINATRISIIEMACKQLSRQIKETLKGLK